MGSSSSKVLVDVGSKFKWYHWAGGLGTACAFNGGLLWAMGGTYRWFFADDEDSARRFRGKYGLPTEAQRLEVFRWMAPKYDRTVAVVQKNTAAVHRSELLKAARG